MAPLKNSDDVGSGSRTRTCFGNRNRRQKSQNRVRKAASCTPKKAEEPEPGSKYSTRSDVDGGLKGPWARLAAAFLAAAFVLATAALGGCGGGEFDGQASESAAGALGGVAVDRGPHKVPIRLPIRLRFAEDVLASGDSAVVEAQARAWNEALGFQAVLLPGDPGQGCMVDVTFDDVYLDALGWDGSSSPLGACAGRIRLEYDYDPRQLPCVAAHELGHLLTATGEHNADAHSVRFRSCGVKPRAITDDDVAAVLERGRLDQRWLNEDLL